MIVVATNRVRASVAINAPGDLVVSPDGATSHVLSRGDNTVVTVGTATNWVLSRIRVGQTPTSLAIVPDGSKVGPTNSGDNTVSVLSVK